MTSKIIHIEEIGVYVQRTWLSKLSWKMQTVVNQGLRAPDTHFCKNVKIMCRWLRSIVLQNADKDHTFMCSKTKLPAIEKMEHELNYCSVHFADAQKLVPAHRSSQRQNNCRPTPNMLEVHHRLLAHASCKHRL